MLDTPTKRLFPLFLTPFETYLYSDDRPEYPMTFFVQLDLSGDLRRDEFESALDAALDRHPFLLAYIRPAKRNMPCWVPADDARPLLDWGDLDQPIEPPKGEYIDLSSEVGLRVWVRRDDRRAKVTMQFHHCCCDGIGSYQFIGDILWAYAMQTAEGERPGELLELQPHRLRYRGQASYDLKQHGPRWTRIQTAFRDGVKFMLRGATPLAPPSSGLRDNSHQPVSSDTGSPGSQAVVGEGEVSSDIPLGFPHICSHTFDAKQFRQFRHAALDHGQTVNDALLEQLLRLSQRWNHRRRAPAWSQRYCVMLPLDLRESDAAGMPAVNVVTYAFIRRSGRELRNAEALTSSLREQMVLTKHKRHLSPFMHIVFMSGQKKHILPTALIGKRCFATVVLSNTGDPTRRFNAEFPRDKRRTVCGNVIVEDISGVPPMRPKTRASISIFTYRRVLKICMRCDPHYFSGGHTQELLDMYVDQVRQSLGEAG